jgi:hypothetical protein
MCPALECRTLQVLSIGHALDYPRQRFKNRLRALVCRAKRVKPKGHLSLPEEIGKALAEAQLSALDGLAASAALGATACSGFKEVGHTGRIPCLPGANHVRTAAVAQARAADLIAAARPAR